MGLLENENQYPGRKTPIIDVEEGHFAHWTVYRTSAPRWIESSIKYVKKTFPLGLSIEPTRISSVMSSVGASHTNTYSK